MRTTVMVAGALLCAAPAVYAQESPALRAQETTEVEVERTDPNPSYGVGLIVGTTVGPCAKVYLDRKHSLAFAAGSYHFQRGLSVQADWVWEPDVLLEGPRLRMPLYIGAGARLSHWEHDDHMHTDGALRTPVGVAAELAIAPIDIFVEAALDINLLAGGADPHRRAAFSASLGSRYFF